MDSGIHLPPDHIQGRISESLNKPKKVIISDTRRTTPRQVKHRYQGESKPVSGGFGLSPILPASPTSQYGNKSWPTSTTVSENGSGTGAKSSTVASSLLRSASVRLRSTLSRLKRSNSGHTPSKTQTDRSRYPHFLSTDDASTGNRRCSDPLRTSGCLDPPGLVGEPREFRKTGPAKTVVTTSSFISRPKAEVTLVASPREVNSLQTLAPAKLDKQYMSSQQVLPPGCSTWSTRLDPYPPQTPKLSQIPGNSRPIYHCQGPLLLHPVVPTVVKSPKCGSVVAPVLNSSTENRSSCEKESSSGYGEWILSSTAASSLPTRESDNLNSLFDECLDYGDLGRLNFRTGSFMGRYPLGSRSGTSTIASGHRQPRPRQRISGDHDSNLTEFTSQSSGGQVFYLSPCVAYSGVTTRSAPSPSLSSGTSNSGQLPVVGSMVEPCSRTQTKTLPEPIHNVVAVTSGQYEVSSNKSLPTENSSTTALLELEPVLARLISDVSSIEEFRSSLLPDSNVTQDSSPTSQLISAHSTSNGVPSTDQMSHPLEVTARFGSSEFGALTTTQDTNKAPTPSSNAKSRGLDHVDWNLKRQINDLIHLEFAGHGQRLSPARTTPSVLTVSPIPKEKLGSRSSEPSVDAEATETDTELSKNIHTRTRLHPFRWSAGGGSQTSGQHRKTPQLNSLLRAKQVGASAGGSSSADRIIPILARPTNANIGRPSRAGSGPLSASDTEKQAEDVDSADTFGEYSFGGSEIDSRLALWFLSANQLAALRKLALMQLTALAEKYCTNRSPFNWRILKFRGPGATSGYSSHNLPSQPDSVATRPGDGMYRLEQNTSSNVPICSSGFLRATAPAYPCITISAKVIQPGWTTYDGPVFGQSLANWQQRCGYPLPANIINMMDHLSEIGSRAHGLFRRPGGKLRMHALRQKIEKYLDWADFTDWQPYDVADLLKQFFRELPDCLLTNKLSAVLVSVFNHVAPTNHLELLRWSMLCLPDENRIVLEKLLHLLHSLLEYSDVTQMSASNLAVCFAPSLFRLNGIHPGERVNSSHGNTSNSSGQTSNTAPTTSPSSVGVVKVSPRRLRRTTSGPDPKDLADQRTAQLALGLMITHAPSLFEVSTKLLRQIRLLPAAPQIPMIDTLAPNSDWSPWLQETTAQLIRDCNALKSKVWMPISRETWKHYQTGSGVGDSLDGVEVHYKKSVGIPGDPNICPLRTWRCSLTIPEVNGAVLMALIRNQRACWDYDLDESRVLEPISDSIDLYLVTYSTIFPQPFRQMLLLRGCSACPEDGGLTLVSQSVMRSGSCDTGVNDLIGIAYEEHFYIKPLIERSGCRVYCLSRVDLKGHSPDWYINHWGQTLVRRLLNLRRSCRSTENFVHPDG